MHVWVARLGAMRPALPALARVLSDEECARRSRLLRDADQAMFTLTWAMRRILLARYIGSAARAVTFQQGEHGKPSLCVANESPRLHFSVTHSGDVTLLAVACDDVGIDAEEIRPLADLNELSRSFSDLEKRALLALSPERRVPAFFATWSRKEAILKASGLGLAVPLDSFDVSVDPELSSCAFVASRDARLARADWTIQVVRILDGYSSALATRVPAKIISMIECEGETWSR